jgi:hypothetical protein
VGTDFLAQLNQPLRKVAIAASIKLGHCIGLSVVLFHR